MSTELAAVASTMSMWEDEKQLADIKAIFAPKLNTNEFKAYIGMAKANDLNPFLREIWAVKYDEKAPAQIFIGRDGYRKSAQRNPDYNYHIVDAVYSNDIFQYVDGKVRHSYTATNRGQLLGAYCLLHKHSTTEPVYVYCPIEEYSTGKSLWNAATGKQSTMIKKVAEAQCLRMGFQEQYAGSYSEFEETIMVDGEEYVKKTSRASKMSSLLTKKGFNNAKKNTDGKSDNHSPNTFSYDEDGVLLDEDRNDSAQAVNATNGQQVAGNGEQENGSNDSQDELMPCSQEQLESIGFLISEKSVDKAGQLKCLDHFNVTSFGELSYKQAEAVIRKLNKME